MVNVANMNRWIEAVRSETVAGRPFLFDMWEWCSSIPLMENAHGHPCGTAACLGGAADMLISEDRGIPLSHVDLDDIVAWSGIAASELQGIFHPAASGSFYASPLIGAKVLERLRDTGKDHWEEVMEEVMEEAFSMALDPA